MNHQKHSPLLALRRIMAELDEAMKAARNCK